MTIYFVVGKSNKLFLSEPRMFVSFVALYLRHLMKVIQFEMFPFNECNVPVPVSSDTLDCFLSLTFVAV